MATLLQVCLFAVGWACAAVAVGMLVGRAIRLADTRRRPGDSAPPPAGPDERPMVDGEASRRCLEPGRVVFVGCSRGPQHVLDALTSATDAEVVIAVVGPGELTRPEQEGTARAAASAGVPALHVQDINAPRVITLVRGVAPDLLVVDGSAQLAGGALLAVPRRGCVGFQVRLRPDNHRWSSISWAILRGERQIDNTMVMLDPDDDGGDIVDRQTIRIEHTDTCATIHERVTAAGAEMLHRNLSALLAGTAPRRPQVRSDEDALPPRTAAMGVTDWARPASAVHDWIRALAMPCSGAFTTIRGRRAMLWSACLADASDPRALPGAVVGLDVDGVRIATGARCVVVIEMSDPGRPPRPAVQWCRDAGVGLGDRFDEVPLETARWALGLAAASRR